MIELTPALEEIIDNIPFESNKKAATAYLKGEGSDSDIPNQVRWSVLSIVYHIYPKLLKETKTVDHPVILRLWSLYHKTEYGSFNDEFIRSAAVEFDHSKEKIAEVAFKTTIDKVAMAEILLRQQKDMESEITKYLFPTYKNNIITKIKKKHYPISDVTDFNGYSVSYFSQLVALLIKKYPETIEEILEYLPLQTEIAPIINAITDHALKEQILRKRLSIMSAGFCKKATIFTDYIDTGVITPALTTLLKKTWAAIEAERDWDSITSFYEMLLSGITPDETWEFYTKYISLVLLLSPVKAYGIIPEAKRSSYTIPTFNSLYRVIKETDADTLLEWYKKEPQATIEVATIFPPKALSRTMTALLEKEKDTLFPLSVAIVESSKKVAKEILPYYKNYEDGLEIFKTMLQSKKEAAREAAIRFLATIETEEVTTLLQTHLADEKKKSVVTALNEALANRTAVTANTATTIVSKEELLKRVKESKAKPPYWLKKLWDFSPLIWKENGEKAPKELITYLVSLASRNQTVVPDFEVRSITQMFTQESLSTLIKEIFDCWDRKSNTKWVLALVASTKDEQFIDILFLEIEKLTKISKGALAANVVRAIAMIGTPKAIQKVDWISRKIRHKQVKNGALEALETAADDLGISKDDLLDMIVPTFGLNSKGEVEYDFGERQFIVSLQSDLSLSITDKASGKSFKNLPKAGAKDNAEKAAEATKAFKELKKGVKEQVTIQKERLERSLSRQRIWDLDKWKTLFIENPLMNQFATGLIWGKRISFLKLSALVMKGNLLVLMMRRLLLRSPQSLFLFTP